MRKFLELFQAMVAPWLLLWRLLCHRLGVWPVMFPAESALDRRMERLLLIWRYARKRSLRELRAS